MRVFVLVLLLLHALPGLAQEKHAVQGRGCATERFLETMKQQDAGYEQRHRLALEAVQQAMRQQPEGQYLRQAVISIPVVFHVVYANARENISDEQILSQLAVLNADFRRMNADTANTPGHFKPFAADTQIEFCLAIVDTEGNPTTGITRTQTSRANFSYFSDNVKSTQNGGTDAWDHTQYLNIWVCNLANDELGYASVPGVSPGRDGVVLHYRAVGAAPANNSLWAYNLGRTATHEVGHWLGLQHIWGSGMTCNSSDGIDDTPNQLRETQGCPGGIVVSCDNGPFGNMWQNYMDYTDDACMNLFTQGQATYMQSVLLSARAYMYNSVACTGELRSRFQTAQPEDTLLAPGDQVQFLGSFAGFRPTAWLWHFEGGTPASSTKQNPTVRYSRPGKYRVTLTTSNNSSSHTLQRDEYIYVTPDEVKVYPNPAIGSVTIETTARQQVQQVELLNRHGQVVLREQAQDRVVRLDVQGLAAGMYILRITGTTGITIKKVTILK